MAYPENNNTDFNGARQNVGGGSFANTGENATYSATFTGSGPLAKISAS